MWVTKCDGCGNVITGDVMYFQSLDGIEFTAIATSIQTPSHSCQYHACGLQCVANVTAKSTRVVSILAKFGK